MTSEPSPKPSLRQVDDLALLRRVADHRPEALAELFDRYAPLLLGLTRRIVGAAGAADEALQETFLQAWTQAPRYDPARWSVSTWLVLIARGRALDRRRLPARPGEASGAPPRGVDGSARPEESDQLRERRARVRAALAELPAEQRQVLELAFWEGLSPSEIARRTAAEPGAVRGHALLALKRVRQVLREQIRELM